MADPDRGDGQVSDAEQAVPARRRRARRPAGPPPNAVAEPVHSEPVETDADKAGSADEGTGESTSAGPRAARRWPVIAASIVAVAVIAGLVTASVLFAQGTSRIDDRNSQRGEYSAFARQMIIDLTSLSPSTIDSALKTFQTKTSGKAMQQMQTSMQQTTDLIKTQGVSTTGTVLSDAVTASDDDTATVILVSGWTMTEKGSAEPAQVQTFRWRVQITRINGDLKLTNIEWVT